MCGQRQTREVRNDSHLLSYFKITLLISISTILFSYTLKDLKGPNYLKAPKDLKYLKYLKDHKDLKGPMNLKGIKVPEGIGGGERVKKWGLAVGAWGSAGWCGMGKKEEPRRVG